MSQLDSATGFCKTFCKVSNNCFPFLGPNWCSQIRRTRQPLLRRTFRTSWSRWTFRSNFCFQKETLLFGMRRCRGHPCQKQPSTKIATLSARNTKSGLPGRATPRRQPEMRFDLSKPASFSSVDRFWVARTPDIIALRRAVETVSI